MKLLQSLTVGGQVPVFAIVGADRVGAVDDLCLSPWLEWVVSAMYFAPHGAPAAVLGGWSAVGMALATGLVILVGIAGESLMRAFSRASLMP